MTTLENQSIATWSNASAMIAEERAANHARIKLMLVDDDDDFRESASCELEDQGFEVTALADGHSLLEHLAAGNPADVIVLDWRLESATGLDLLPLLRRRGVQIPIVFLTGLASTDHERAALDRGAVDFIDKGRGVAILVRRIRLIMESFGQRDRPPVEDIARGSLTLRPKVSRAYWNNQDVGLTVTEFNIVHLLVAQGGDYVTYRAIYDCVHWRGFIAGSGDDGYRTNVRSAIKRIRGKFHLVDAEFAEIETFPGFGYRWRSGGDDSPAQEAC